MAHLVTSDDEHRDLARDDAYRSYLITRTDSLSTYRFGRTLGTQIGARLHSALARVNVFMKKMIEAIANSKRHRLERELQLRGIRYDPSSDSWIGRNSGRHGARD